MRSFATFLAFMVMALALNFCNAAPHTKPSRDISGNVGDPIDTSLPNTIADDSITNVGDLIDTTPPNTNGTDDTNTQNKCYDWDSSEKWKDVGGQHSDFVNQAVYDLCQLVAIEAYKGFPAGNTVRSILSQHPAINNINFHFMLTATHRLPTARRSVREVMGGITIAASA